MFLTKKHLPRRTFLRGLGATVALPLLDAMVPAGTALAQTAAKAAPRMGFVYFPHGAVMERWTPDAEGRDFELKQILAPLAPFKDRLTIVSGLENKHADGPVHAITPGTWLSCVTPRATHDPYGGVTADQIAAQDIGQDTPLPSLELCIEGRGGNGVCDRNFGCSYSETIAFRTPSTPLPMELNPRKVFQRLFGEGDTAAERARLQRQYTSILDLISSEAQGLKRTLGAADQARVSDYLDSVREMERRVQKLADRDLSSVAVPDAPVGVPKSFEEHIGLLFDLTALAWQANLTRITTLMMQHEVSSMTFNQIGVRDAFHPLSHHQNNADKIERLAKVQTYNTRIFAKFIKKLAETPDGDGSLLDHSIILFGSNMSNSNAHDHFPLPSAILGGGYGKLKGGRHVRYADRTPLANLHLTLLERAGVPIEKLGDSTGDFAEV